jgi:hypothetical protein
VSDAPKLDPITKREIRADRAFLSRLKQPESRAGSPSRIGSLDDRYRYVLENLRAMTVDVAALGAGARKLREGDEPVLSVVRARHKDGHWVWMEGAGASAYQQPSGRPSRSSSRGASAA